MKKVFFALSALVAVLVLAVPAAATHESFVYDPPPENGVFTYDAPAVDVPFTVDPGVVNGIVSYDALPVDVPFSVDPPEFCVDPPADSGVIAGITVTLDPPPTCVDPPPTTGIVSYDALPVDVPFSVDPGVINGIVSYDAPPVDIPYTHDPPPPPPPVAQCADGLDNDGDGLIDFPADPGCVDAADNDEFNAPPPPPPSDLCSVDNREEWGPIYNEGDCEFGTTITVTNQLWFCSTPLSNLGPLPIRVVQTWNIAAQVGQNGIELRTGCSGDGTPAIDLIVEQYLVGVGRISDPFKTRMSPGPQNVDVTGFLNASGPLAVPGVGDHQDCIQLQGGAGNNFVNIKGCGDYAAGESNTQAAGGTVFYSLNASQASVLGGEFIGCHASLYAHPGEVAPGSKIVDAKFRSGNNTAPWCAKGNFFTSPPCTDLDGDLQLINVTCQRYINGAWVNVAPQ